MPNEVTINPAPKKPLTFGDIKPGEFRQGSFRCVKMEGPIRVASREVNSVNIDNGCLFWFAADSIVTLPAEEPLARYCDLACGELFEWPVGSGKVWKKCDVPAAMPLHDGDRLLWFNDGDGMITRVRRVRSVTITAKPE